MQVSKRGIEFIKQNEGYSPVPVLEPNGKWMWGYGHDQLPGEPPPDSILPEEAESLLLRDLQTRFAPDVNRYAPWCTDQAQFDALVDFDYNLGPVALCTMLRHGREAIPQQIPHWCHATVNGIVRELPGLVARRQKEVQLFTEGIYG